MVSWPGQALLLQTRPALAIKIPVSRLFVSQIVAAGSRNRRQSRSAKSQKVIRQCISAAASTLRLLPKHPLGDVLFNYVSGSGGKGGGSDFWRGFGWGRPDRNWRRKMLGFDVVLMSVTILLVFGRAPEDRDLEARIWAWCSSLLGGFSIRAWSRHWILACLCFCVVMAVAFGLRIEYSKKLLGFKKKAEVEIMVLEINCASFEKSLLRFYHSFELLTRIKRSIRVSTLPVPNFCRLKRSSTVM